MCAQNHQKKAAVVGTLVRKFRSIFISKSSLHIARASSRRCIAQRSNCADRTASFRWKQRQFRRKTGWVLWRTHSKNRAEIRKNEFSFLRNRRYFSCVFRYNSSLKKRGLPHQNRRIIYDFSSKKAANTPPETLEKFENAHLIYINFICQWAYRSTNCIAVCYCWRPLSAARSSAAAWLWSRNFSTSSVSALWRMSEVWRCSGRLPDTALSNWPSWTVSGLSLPLRWFMQPD